MYGMLPTTVHHASVPSLSFKRMTGRLKCLASQMNSQLVATRAPTDKTEGPFMMWALTRRSTQQQDLYSAAGLGRSVGRGDQVDIIVHKILQLETFDLFPTDEVMT